MNILLEKSPYKPTEDAHEDEDISAGVKREGVSVFPRHKNGKFLYFSEAVQDTQRISRTVQCSYQSPLLVSMTPARKRNTMNAYPDIFG